MKCPECDQEQPDNAELCSNCGLSFEAWRAHNPAPPKADKKSDEGMTFPVSREEFPTPVEEEDSAEAEPASPPETDQLEKPAQGKPGPPRKKQPWKFILFGGLGLVAVLVFLIIFSSHRTAPPSPGSVEPTPVVLGTVVPSPSTPPINATPASAEISPTPPPIPKNTNTAKAAPPESKSNQVKAKEDDQAPSQEDSEKQEGSAAAAPPPDGESPAMNASQEKPEANGQDKAVTMEMPSEDSVSSGSGSVTPTGTPTETPKDLLENSEPVQASTPSSQ